MLRRLISILILTVIGISHVSAQDKAASWSIADIKAVADIFGPGYDLHYVRLAPDGSALAAGDPKRGFCLYPFAAAKVTCYPWPEKFRGFGRFSGFTWSPDGTTIAFTESLFDYFNESDLWVFDVQSGTYTDRTDDGNFGGILKPSKDGKPYLLDYLPTWNPANGDLYFFRSVRDTSGNTSLELYLFPLKDTEPKLVRDLSSDFPIFSVFRQPVISPDGSQMALIVLPNKRDDTRNGLWTLSLKDGKVTQVATMDVFKAGLPAWGKDHSALMPETVSWVGDNGLLVSAADYQFATMGVAQNVFYIDLTTQAAKPMVDFSDVPDRQAFFKVGPDGTSAMFRIPRAGVSSPDGKTFWYLNRDVAGEQAGISALALPLDGAAPRLLEKIDDFKVWVAATSPAQISADGKALLYGYLVTFIAE
jgi:hypothetical protein